MQAFFLFAGNQCLLSQNNQCISLYFVPFYFIYMHFIKLGQVQKSDQINPDRSPQIT